MSEKIDIITVTDKDGWDSFVRAEVGADFVVCGVHYDADHKFIEKIKVCEFDGLKLINEHEETREQVIEHIKAGKIYKTARRIVFGHLYPWKNVVIEKTKDGTEIVVVSQKGDDLNFSIPSSENNEEAFNVVEELHPVICNENCIED
ncbi:hypothetical protein COMNV_00738 [Commensalibacter sp. Nvir]|uniref:DUF3892 domain-containing protein n=1 Tax=Commensalibacter sp. Nvir TaxID=3069817 RepID=UPI002D2B0349|nr:hypothetical protein COMNV_00738 [Commensalibacter sp. Nvir]